MEIFEQEEDDIEDPIGNSIEDAAQQYLSINWYTKVLKYLQKQPEVKYNNDFLDFVYKNISEILHFDREKRSVGLHSPFVASRFVACKLLEDACKKNRVQIKRRKKNGGPFPYGYLEVKVNKYSPSIGIQRLFSTIKSVYDTMNKLERK